MNIRDIQLQFERAQRHFEQLLEMLASGAFLSEDDFAQTFHTLVELKNAQESCLRFLAEEGLTAPSDAAHMTLRTAQALVQRYEEQKERERRSRQLRALVQEFASVQAGSDRYRAELESRQRELSACGEARLLEMDQSGQLQPYRDFVACLRAPGVDAAAAESLAEAFGYQLAFALLTGRLSLRSTEPDAPEEERPAITAEAAKQPTSASKGAAEQEAPVEEDLPPAEQEAPFEEALPPMEQEAPVEEELPPAEQEAAAEEALPPMEQEALAVPAPEDRPAESPDLPPLTDEALLGTLTIDRRQKPPKGPKALLNLVRNHWGRKYILKIVNTAMTGWFSPETLTGKEPAEEAGPYERCLDLLVKEGYLVCCTLSGTPERQLYSASPEGLKIFKKEAVRRYLYRRVPDQGIACIREAVEFLRIYEGRRVLDRIISDEIPLSAVLRQDGRGVFLRIAEKKAEPPICMVLPAALYTPQDAPEDIRQWCGAIGQTVKDAGPALAVFLSVYDAEQISGWKNYLRRNAGFAEDVRFFCGVLGDERYLDEEGRGQSLTGWLQARTAEESPAQAAELPAEDALAEEVTAEEVPAEAASAQKVSAEVSPAQDAPAEDREEAPAVGEPPAVESALFPTPEEGPCPSAPAAEPLPEPASAGPEQGSRGPEEDAPAPAQEPVVLDVQNRTARENAALLLQQPEHIGLNQLLCLTVQLISENRIAEAVSLAESMAESPAFGAKIKDFYQAFRQSVQQPGQNYRYSSDVIDLQQSHLILEEGAGGGRPLRILHQTMILTSALWAMAFPSVAYDHNLYNNAGMLLSGELQDALSDECSALDRLMKLLSTDLKELSFQNDGLGFSPGVIGSLVDDGEQERNRLALGRKAEALQKTPTSTVQITGLETFLKQIVGPTSVIGDALRDLTGDRRDQAGKIRSRLERNLALSHLELTDSWLEEYIDTCWTSLRRENPDIKVKRLDKDSPAQRVCKKALTERLRTIIDWLEIVEGSQNSKFQQFRDQYARLWNQLKKALSDLKDALCGHTGGDCCLAACRNLLLITAGRMQKALDSLPAEDETLFYLDLWKTPELMIETSGENRIVPELYDIDGLEPWVFLLRGIAAPAGDPEEILRQIDDYNDNRWYRNFGLEALLCRAIGRQPVDRSESCQAARAAMKQEIQEFEGSIRMDRAYGRLQEHVMETAFSALRVVKDIYEKTGNFASFHGFLVQLRQVLDKTISRQVEKYRRRVQELEHQAEYAESPILEVIHKALESGSLNSVDTYINYMQSGETELPTSVRTRTGGKNFLAEFQSCEDGYYLECQKHSGNALSNWGGAVLEQMDRKYRHWTSPNERVAGQTWVKNWLQSKNSPTGPERVSRLLSGLGFEVQRVDRKPATGRMGMNECYQVEAKRVSTALTDYPHPVYKFGTELSVPMNVVCLYGCQGVSTLIQVMTNDLQLSGSTIVFMDGSLTSGDRRLMAEKLKTDTSGQSLFLLIDRVLALYLTSVDRGDRQNAMLRCTLPYIFEVLYGNGSGAVPEEMFIGRMMEMRDLRNEQGPSLVYGGRQLGKTALLNRASKTLHAPQRKEYSFCVEVKDCGSETLLERVNGQLKRLGLLQESCASLAELCGTLQEMWENHRITMLRVFVDEVDSLFEEFQQNEYAALRPFINLRDNTKHKVRFVFAGTHNVAATDMAERENNNLIHMGKPLCIKPLSSDDAMDLIRIPMAYLGFEIGEPQIELILSNTNSYPGLIHMFCNALIQSVCRDYEQCCGDETYPPYRISDAQMQTVFREQDIRKEIGQRVMATIRLNRKYKAVSYLLALMVYEDQDRGRSSLYGYTARELQDFNQRESQLPLLMKIKEKDLNTLMDEMENMGILWKNGRTQQFRFRQQDFLAYIGDSEKLVEALLEEDWESA